MTRWYLVGVIILCNAGADLMNTLGMRRNGKVTDLAPEGIAKLFSALARNGYVIVGIAAMAAAFFALLSLLSIARVSFAVPATAGGFLIETVLAKVVLKEDVRWQRWVGGLVVSGGVCLLALP
jgi:drug/metabolite transporter (DMT)-like permease